MRRERERKTKERRRRKRGIMWIIMSISRLVTSTPVVTFLVSHLASQASQLLRILFARWLSLRTPRLRWNINDHENISKRSRHQTDIYIIYLALREAKYTKFITGSRGRNTRPLVGLDTFNQLFRNTREYKKRRKTGTKRGGTRQGRVLEHCLLSPTGAFQLNCKLKRIFYSSASGTMGGYHESRNGPDDEREVDEGRRGWDRTAVRIKSAVSCTENIFSISTARAFSCVFRRFFGRNHLSIISANLETIESNLSLRDGDISCGNFKYFQVLYKFRLNYSSLLK